MFRNIGAPEIIVIAVLVILVFGWKRLPDAARSLGRSARVFKSEVDEMKREGSTSGSQGETVSGETVNRASSNYTDTAHGEGNAVHENAPKTDNRSGPIS